jgi:hypothetical protein
MLIAAAGTSRGTLSRLFSARVSISKLSWIDSSFPYSTVQRNFSKSTDKKSQKLCHITVLNSAHADATTQPEAQNSEFRALNVDERLLVSNLHILLPRQAQFVCTFNTNPTCMTFPTSLLSL